MVSQVSDAYTVTIPQARKALLSAFRVKRPVFLWGPPGLGKSELVAEIAEEMKGVVIDIRMAQMEPTDIRGIPYYNKDKNVMEYAPPVDLPDAEFAAQYPVVVLFLDEMNSAPPSVQAAGYQLILNRRVGKYVLPDNVVIVAAGNRDSDRGVTYRMPMPLANRFVHIEMRPDFNSWQDWAVNHGVHQDVVGYLSFAKQDMYDFDAKSSSKAFATPRSWVFVSDLIKDETLDTETQFTLVAGAVGEGLAAKFKAHRKYVDRMPSPTDILSGKVTTLEVKEISAMYALTTGMCYELRDANADPTVSKDQFGEMMSNFIQFMMDNFETELVVMGSRIALKVYDLPFEPTKIRNFDQFFKKYGKLIVQNGR